MGLSRSRAAKAVPASMPYAYGKYKSCESASAPRSANQKQCAKLFTARQRILWPLSDQQSMSGQRGTSMSAIRGASLAVRPRRVLPVNDTDSRAELPRNCTPFCHPYQARGEASPVHRARISGPFEWWKLCDPLVSFSSNFPIAEADHVAPAILTAFESPSWSDIRGADDSNCVRRVMLLQCT